MAQIRSKSLRTKFLVLLALGGSLVASAGVWITYTATVGHFEAQIIERGRVLIDSLNHSAMVADTPMQVQHIVDKLSLSPHIQNIVITIGKPPEIMAASNRAWSGANVAQLPDRHIYEHLLEVRTQAKFRYYFEDHGDVLFLTAPLEPHLSIYQAHDAAMMPSDAGPKHGTSPEHSEMNMGRPDHDMKPNTMRDRLPYRGVIMLFLDNREASAAVSQILWLLCTALLAAVLITMGIAYFLVDRQILARLSTIRRAMTKQNSNAGAARVSVAANDEIGELGRAFNNMIDRIDAETERREGAVNKLKNSEERIRSIVDNSPTKIHIKDLDGRYVLVNRVSEMLFGVPEEEILGKTSHDIFPDKRADSYIANDQAVLDYGQTLEQEEQWDLGDRAQTFLTIKFPIRDGDGEIVAIGAIGTDITERRRIEDALQASNDSLERRVEERTAAIRDHEKILQAQILDLEEAHRKLELQGADLVRLADNLLIARDEARAADRAKSEFLAAMSHELRTPLNAVIGFSEIIKDEAFGPVGSANYRNYAQDINDSGQHLLGLINDILDLSKIESGTEELHEDTIEISAIGRSTMKMVGQRAKQDGIKLELELQDPLPPLRADERKLKQILVNLLSNAVKFTDAGGEATLKIWCRRDSGYVFQIVDSGIGIAPEDIPKALSRFGQIDADLNRQYEGTGLGLPLTKALVELHGGALDLQSEVGVGTTVTVRFPAERIVTSLDHADPLAVTAGAAS